MSKKILITSALLYANGPLHFGHLAGAYLPADCFARFQRLMGNDVLFISGSDEYGVAITLSAEIAKRSPREHVDFFHKVNKDLFKKLSFSFDHYSRTTWEGHEAPSQNFFTDLLENGWIEPKVTDQLYSENEQRFMADRYVTGTCPECGYEKARGDECPSCSASYEATDLKEPRSKQTGSKLVLKKTKHWFLLLDRMKDQLLKWIETKDWKPNVLAFVKNYIKDLHPRAITRDAKWGIPIPLDGTGGKVLYVWFDAPIGYISATMEWAKLQGKDEVWKEWWLDPDVNLIHFIGKDNIPFHAVIFPAMIMGQKTPYKLVDEIPANEFCKLEGRQFSKSDGWYIDLEDFLTRYSADQIRYTLAANAPETADSEFTWKDFQRRCNGELLGKLGNLVHRTLVFTQKQCNGIPPVELKLQEEDHLFLKKLREKIKEIQEAYGKYRLRRACRLIMEACDLGNTYFDQKKPWKAEKDSMNTTIHCCLECLKSLALISSPIIPETSQKIWEMLGQEGRVEALHLEKALDRPIATENQLPEPQVLFEKIENEAIEAELAKLGSSNEESNVEPLKDQITFDDFSKIDLRVATILEATAVPKSKKLIQLLVDVGFEKRTVVAGISNYYKPTELVGKKVVVVANLKPAKLMGVESQGMVLAGKLDKALELAEFSSVPPGSVVS